jgi:hypothetical protein
MGDDAYPGPWAWDSDPRLTGALRDANGTAIVFGQCIEPTVRTIIAAAPEMLALLREEFDEPHRYCGGTCWDCRRRAVLARIDEAGK